MSVENNKATIRAYVHQVWNKGDLTTLDAFISPDYAFTDSRGSVVIRGAEELKKIVAAIRSAFPDHHLTILDMIGERDRVAWRWQMSGTHLGDFMGIEPTGKAIGTTGIAIYRIADGKIVERQGEADTLGLLAQLGAIPEFG